MSIYEILHNIAMDVLNSWVYLVTFYLICYFLRTYYTNHQIDINSKGNVATIAAGSLGAILCIFYIFR